VRFAARQQAQQAIQAMNGVALPGMDHAITVRFADTTEDKIRKKSGITTKSMGMMTMQQAAMFSRYNPYMPMMYADPSQMMATQMMSAVPEGTDATTLSSSSSGTGYCLFVYNLPPSTDENFLYRLFGPYGAVLSVKVIRNLGTGECKGYGFVNYLRLEEAQSAVVNLNGFQINNKRLQVSFKRQS